MTVAGERWRLRLFALTLFLSSFLLFLVQPLVARLVLPELGGSPAVWTTAMLFFQTLLLGGYAYAHLLATRFTVRRQALVHGALLLLPLLSLPLAYPANWLPPAEATPIFWLLTLLAVMVGLPFFVLAASNPILQSWFSRLAGGEDPYFLYAASNSGSLAALLAYPFIVEPLAGVTQQGAWWSLAYLLLVLLFWACARLARKNGTPTPTTEQAAPPPASAPPLSTQLRWLILALVPSSLLLSVTNHISTDLAAVPLLWVVPLALYLLTFILAFGGIAPRLLPGSRLAMPIALTALTMILAMGSNRPLSLMLSLHLGVFVVTALTLHLELAAARPPVHFLTRFYLLMAAGGALGGLVNALIAPLLFDSLAEYPLMVVVAALLCRRREGSGKPATAEPPLDRKGAWRRVARLARGLVGPALVGGGALAATVALGQLPRQVALSALPLAFGLPALGAWLLSASPRRFALALAALLAVGQYGSGGEELELARRSFFGIHRVWLNPVTERRQLAHGNTLHGSQSTDELLSRIPGAYYHPSGPIGQLLSSFQAPHPLRVAAIGLGVGALASYSRPGEHWTFFEIDPTVAGIASDVRYFTYLSRAAGSIRLVLGDGRRRLAETPDRSFDLIVVDAYSSDSIPVHLATREALRLWLEKLAPRGLLVFHLSNQYLDLAPVLGNLAADAGLFAVVQQDDKIGDLEAMQGKDASRWLVMARSVEEFPPPLRLAPWQPAPPDPDGPLWTDDYSSLLDLL